MKLMATASQPLMNDVLVITLCKPSPFAAAFVLTVQQSSKDHVRYIYLQKARNFIDRIILHCYMPSAFGGAAWIWQLQPAMQSSSYTIHDWFVYV